MEGFLEAVAAFRHGFGANGNSAFYATGTDLIGDILHRFQAGGAEAVNRGSGAGGGEAGSKRGSTGNVGGFSVGYLFHVSEELDGSWSVPTFPRQMSSTICGSMFDFSMTFLSSW